MSTMKKNMPDALLSEGENDVKLELGKDNERDCHAIDSGDDDEDRMVDAQIINYSSDVDEEREHARDKLSKHIQLRKAIEENANDSDKEDENAGRGTDSRNYQEGNVDTANLNETGKVSGYEIDYINSSDLGNMLTQVEFRMQMM